MSDTARLSRLRWICRRGMKELDVMLEAFLESHRQALQQGDYPDLEAFLAAEDDQLWDWMQRRQSPPHPQWRELVALIRGDPR